MDRLYEHTSSSRTASQIGAVFRDGIEAHAEDHQLGGILAGALHCCETRSVRRKKPGVLSRLTGSGDPDTEHRTVAIVTSRYLVVAVAGDKRGVHVGSARLDGLSLTSFALTAGIDSGVSATGLWSGGDMAATRHIGLGDDPAGRAFQDRLRSAIAEAKSA